MEQTISLGGLELPIKPTPLVKLAKMMPVLDSQDMFSEVAVTALAESIFHGIRRAGGEVTQDFVSENIDLLNVNKVFDVFFEVNGLERKKVGKEGESGEGAAGAAS